jgi:hypothetical protein
MISTHRIMPASHTRQWWLAGGIHPSQVVAAYQPKGAVDLAASYVNLANPGTNDATPIVAPTIDSSGWVFSGSAALLGPIASEAPVLFRFSDKTTIDFFAVFGVNIANESRTFLPYASNSSPPTRSLLYTGGGSTQTSPGITSGVVAIAGNKYYINGVDTGETISTVVSAINYGIGKAHRGSNNFTGITPVKFQACLFFNTGTTLSAPQIAALSAAMAAL